MILYHFTTSPFSRRVRLALAHKKLSAELRDARAVAEHRAEVNRLNPLHTVPVLVDGEVVVSDSTAILHYLERKFPDPPLWPGGITGAETFAVMALCDAVSNILSDCGMRYHALSGDPQFPQVRDLVVGRAQRALEALSARVAARGLGRPLCGTSWSAADMSVYCLVTWLTGLPVRAASFAPAAQVLSLGWSLPVALTAWAEQHHTRSDVVALG
ncbi:MAG: putative glutathione S-transferase-like protein [Polyangiaceae bacterium]|nr:putative glutathione S-transferase-like protein [Polyangiaceae bacterium]